MITIKPGEDLLNLDMLVLPPQKINLTEAPDLTSPDTTAQLDLPSIQAGEIVPLEDHRFSSKNARRGLWERI